MTVLLDGCYSKFAHRNIQIPESFKHKYGLFDSSSSFTSERTKSSIFIILGVANFLVVVDGHT